MLQPFKSEIFKTKYKSSARVNVANDDEYEDETPEQISYDEESDHESGTCNTTKTAPSKEVCIKCKGNHEVKFCKEFKALNSTQRFEFSRIHRMCRSCTKTGHFAWNCKDGERCSLCRGRHHVLFHDDSFQARRREETRKERSAEEKKTTPTSTTLMTRGEEEPDEVSPIVPVYISSRENPEQEKLIYAVLDTQSDSCFIDQKTAEDLNLSGVNVQLKLNTMSGTEHFDTQKIHGLQVEGKDRAEMICLPRVYVKENIAAEHTQIPHPNKVKRWRHLKCIADQLHPVDENISISMLIGRNCLKAIKPLSILPGDDEDPYAVRTRLGWGIVGQIGSPTKDGQGTAWTFRTSAREVKPADFTEHYGTRFHREESVRENVG